MGHLQRPRKQFCLGQPLFSIPTYPLPHHSARWKVVLRTAPSYQYSENTETNSYLDGTLNPFPVFLCSIFFFLFLLLSLGMSVDVEVTKGLQGPEQKAGQVTSGEANLSPKPHTLTHSLTLSSPLLFPPLPNIAMAPQLLGYVR